MVMLVGFRAPSNWRLGVVGNALRFCAVVLSLVRLRTCFLAFNTRENENEEISTMPFSVLTMND